LRGRRLALELVEQLDSLFGLRHCGRRLPKRDHPSAYGQMGRCLSPCLGDLDPNLYRRRLDEALRLFVQGPDAGAQLLEYVSSQMRQAAEERRYERAAWLRRRTRRLSVILTRLEGVLEATHARPRLIIAAHPTKPSGDAFWVVGGRVVDWGPLPSTLEELERRTQAALGRGGRSGELGAHVPPDEIDEMRILVTYLASHPGVGQLVLEPRPPSAVLEAFAQLANGSSTTPAPTAPSPTSTVEPGGASRRTRASAIGPKRGETQVLPTRPTIRPSSLTSSPRLTGAEHLSPRR
jgi:DNA polymerase-3 subunit epsilon